MGVVEIVIVIAGVAFTVGVLEAATEGVSAVIVGSISSVGDGSAFTTKTAKRLVIINAMPMPVIHPCNFFIVLGIKGYKFNDVRSKLNNILPQTILYSRTGTKLVTHGEG